MKYEMSTTSTSSTIVQRVWNYCNVLRDDGISYGDYVEQLTYLLFLKMADEWTKPPFNKPSTLPKELNWQSLLSKDGSAIDLHYRHILETLRPLIKAIVDVMRPAPNETICDPACGTGGFLLASHDYISKNYALDKDQKKFLKFDALRGWEIVDNAARLCVMNLFLHGIGGEESPIIVGDTLISDPGLRFDKALTNPPFGKRSSITIFNEEGKYDKESVIYERQDFWVTTSNKQLNFLQHVKTLLKINGKAAIILPDNVLFEGGAGERVRRKLLAEFDVHTLLRLPTGVFYSLGVKANVLFFDKKPASEKPWTEKLWIYDLRTNKHFTLKTNPLQYEDLQDFIKCYNPENRFNRKETERFKAFTYNDLLQRDKVNMDIFWLKDESLEDSENLPEPNIIAKEIAENLESALEQFASIHEDLIVKDDLLHS